MLTYSPRSSVTEQQTVNLWVGGLIPSEGALSRRCDVPDVVKPRICIDAAKVYTRRV